MRKFGFFVLLVLITNDLFSQSISGTVYGNGISVPDASVKISESNQFTSTDSTGRFEFLSVKPGKYVFRVAAIGYKTLFKSVIVTQSDSLKVLNFDLTPDANLSEVVVTGTLKEVSRLESAVPVEIYNHTFFKKNPTPSIFDALQNVNGVRPQLNCNVCNTGDIHINGLEGPYTMVLIDGMPLVSSLSTVYGLSGIPNSLIERVEIVKGPASSLYGSEVHEVAEQLEHIHSPKLVDKLDKFLGFPEFDPHGDAIPNAKGELKQSSKKTLSEVESGSSCKMVAVKDNTAAFLQYVSQLNLGIDTPIKVISKQAFDGSMEIMISDTKIMVSQKFAENILIV